VVTLPLPGVDQIHESIVISSVIDLNLLQTGSNSRCKQQFKALTTALELWSEQ
jgi:hypothetical protein